MCPRGRIRPRPRRRTERHCGRFPKPRSRAASVLFFEPESLRDLAGPLAAGNDIVLSTECETDGIGRLIRARTTTTVASSRLAAEVAEQDAGDHAAVMRASGRDTYRSRPVSASPSECMTIKASGGPVGYSNCRTPRSSCPRVPFMEIIGALPPSVTTDPAILPTPE